MMRTALVILAAFLLGTLPSKAQDAGQEPKFYKVFNVKLKPGKALEADAFVTKYLTPADDAIGRKVITFVYQTGAWDRITYFPARATENGIDTIPSEQAWWEAFVKQEGGEEQAQARIAEFMDLVDVFEVEIAKPQRWDMVNE
jgi:hypothetical protein